jgi:DNA primase
MTQRDLLQLATNYHKALPGRIRRYLNERGISDILIDYHLLGWNGNRITIPIFNRQGELAFFKLAKDPEDPVLAPKMLATPGSYAELYGWEVLAKEPKQVIICEGEFDRMVLEEKGFLAVTSTGGAGTFRAEWATAFESIPNVYICYDNDNAGRIGAERVASLIPHSKIAELPVEVGEAGDVTDFFVHLGKSREDFQKLLDAAMPMPPSPPTERTQSPRASSLDPEMKQRTTRIKSEVPIADLIGQYLKLEPYGDYLMGVCPFHDDHHPSLAVYPVKGTFRCYGCFKHGEVITFIRAIEHLSFVEALDRLGEYKSSYGKDADLKGGNREPRSAIGDER